MPRRKVTPAVVRRLALALPEAVEGSHFDHPDFRVRNKIFASLPSDGRSVSLKSTPANMDALVAADPETFNAIWGGRYLGIRLDRVSVPVLRDLLAESWRLTAPKGLAASLKP